MYRVHCLLPRADAERLSDLLSEHGPLAGLRCLGGGGLEGLAGASMPFCTE